MARLIALSGRIEDDRGEPHGQGPSLELDDGVSFRLVSAKAARGGGARDPSRRSAFLAVRALRAASQARFLPLGYVLYVVGVGVMMRPMLLRLDWSTVIGIAMMITVPAVGVVITPRLRRRLDTERAELPPACAACAYDLSGAPVEDDGCTVCSECGAAWRLPICPA